MKTKLMKQTKTLSAIAVFILSFFVLSCDNELHITMPKGPEGPAGKSAYEVWVEDVENGKVDWPKDRVETKHFYLFLKGKDGKDGINGQDGESAYQLWLKEVEKGISDPHNPGQQWDKGKTEVNDFWYFLTGADGKDGKHGSTPYIGENGNWFIDGIDTTIPARGKDGADGKEGTKITISENNTWVVDGTDTGIPLTGADGKDGKEVYIGENGNWYIDGKDTTIPARGKNGENGKDGTNGMDGKNAYEVWVVEVANGLEDPHNPGQEWDKNNVDMDDFWYYLRGKTGADGKDGKDGEHGSVVTIGTDGYWYIDGENTNVPAYGQDGKDGMTPHIGDNNTWWFGTIDTGKPAIGADGQDGADGQNGQDGRTPDIEIIGGYWYIDGDNTNVPAFGQDGADGQDGENGLSAYQLWKKEVETGKLEDPKNPGQFWPDSKNKEEDFWEYLRGQDGADGQDGATGQDGADGQSAYGLWKDEVIKGLLNPHDENGGNWPKDQLSIENFWEYLRGKDGKDGETIIDGQIITLGVPNVISQYVNQEYKEFVNWTDGSVLFVVYNEVGKVSPGATVRGLPGLDPNKEFVANTKGEFIIPKEDLPEGKTIDELTSSVEVTYINSKGNTVTETSAANTYVPNRIRVRLVRVSSSVKLTASTATMTLRLERNVGTKYASWENISDIYFGEFDAKPKVV